MLCGGNVFHREPHGKTDEQTNNILEVFGGSLAGRPGWAASLPGELAGWLERRLAGKLAGYVSGLGGLKS